MTAGRVVLVAGATGLVGRHTVDRLLADPGVARVVALARRPGAGLPASPRLQVELLDFARLAESDVPYGATQVACALGTTIRQAGSRERFREVDLEYPKALAQLARARGVTHFALVSAIGADPRSRVFYNRVKGEAEAAVGACGFRSATILRPSLLLGERSEFRLGEEVAKRFAWLTPPAYRPVHAADVAAALADALRRDDPGEHVIESAAIRRSAGTRGAA